MTRLLRRRNESRPPGLPEPAARRARLRRIVRLLPLVLPFGLAFGSLFEPWARARVTLVWGVTRSPEATLFLAGGLFAALVASVAVTWSGKQPRIAAIVHLATGLLLGYVALQGFTMVKDAGVKALGLLPLVSVRPGIGLRAFAVAAALLGGLGSIELLLAFVWPRRAARRARSAGTSDPGPSAEVRRLTPHDTDSHHAQQGS